MRAQWVRRRLPSRPSCRRGKGQRYQDALKQARAQVYAEQGCPQLLDERAAVIKEARAARRRRSLLQKSESLAKSPPLAATSKPLWHNSPPKLPGGLLKRRVPAAPQERPDEAKINEGARIQSKRAALR